MDSKKEQKGAMIFECKSCLYNTSRKGNYDRHLSTRKHINGSKMIVKKSRKKPAKIMPDDTTETYMCICGKNYKYDSGYYRHIKTCTSLGKIVDTTVSKHTITVEEYKQLFSDILKQNNELQKIIIEQHETHMLTLKELLPKVGNTVNNTLNINVFFNEQFKDALNMSDFLKSIRVNYSDLILTKEEGLAYSVNNQILKAIFDLELHKRPIHCLNTGKETMMIKDENQWDIDKDNVKLKNGIQQLAANQIKQCTQTITTKALKKCDMNNDDYYKLLSNVSCDIHHDSKETKQIIKNVAKKVYLNVDEICNT